MEVFNRNTKIIAVCVYFLLVFITERFYREPLFNYSLSKIPELQQSFSPLTLTFYGYITNLGKFEGILPLIVLIFNYFPISISYFLLLSYIFSFYLDNILKLLYQDPRPYFVNTEIIPYKTDTDFGNPSGHSLASTVFYLALLNISNNITVFKKNRILYYLYSFFIICSLVLLIFSRFILGVHAINQLIFGVLIGLGLYYISFNLIDIDTFTNGTQFFLLNRSNSYNILSFFVYFALIFLSFISYCFFDYDHTYLLQIHKQFPNNPEYKFFENYEFAMTLLIFLVIGAHSGIIYLVYFINKYYKIDKINYDNLNNFESSISELRRLLRFLLILTIMFISSLPFFLVNEFNSLSVIYILKISFPSLLFGFILFAVAPLICLKLDFFPQTLLLELSKNIDEPDQITFIKDSSNLNII